jgi:hypothetical protein
MFAIKTNKVQEEKRDLEKRENILNSQLRQEKKTSAKLKEEMRKIHTGGKPSML